jgi:hypothetical protein
MVLAIVGVAEPVIAAPAVPKAPTQTEPDMPDAEGTDVAPLDLDRDQELVDEATEVAEEAADAVDPPPVPDGALDGMADLNPADADEPVLQDEDGDGVLHPPIEDATATGDAVAIADPEADPALVGPSTPADIEPPWDGGLGDLAEMADDVDLSAYEVGDEIPELRTEGSQTFLDENGHMRTELASEPLFSENAEGELVEPDPTPVGNRDGRWRPAAGYEGTSVAATSGDDQLGSIGFGPGQMLSWSLADANDVAGTPTDDGVLFEDVFDSVDLLMATTASGLKERTAAPKAS